MGKSKQPRIVEKELNFADRRIVLWVLSKAEGPMNKDGGYLRFRIMQALDYEEIDQHFYELDQEKIELQKRGKIVFQSFQARTGETRKFPLRPSWIRRIEEVLSDENTDFKGLPNDEIFSCLQAFDIEEPDDPSDYYEEDEIEAPETETEVATDAE